MENANKVVGRRVVGAFVVVVEAVELRDHDPGRERQQEQQVFGRPRNLIGPGGRVEVLAYHSLEDRMVKERFLGLSQRPALPARLPVRDMGPPAPFRLLSRRLRVCPDGSLEYHLRSHRLTTN